MADFVKVVALYLQDGKLLVGRNADREVFYGIGGKLEAGETHEQCLLREVKEELDCDVTGFEYFDTFTGPSFNKAKIVEMPCFFVELRGHPKPTNEVVELRWVGLDYKSQPLANMLQNFICPALEQAGKLR